MKSLLIALILILVCSPLAYGEDLTAKREKNNWPTCIAQFCFDKEAPRESVLTQRYGNGICKNEGEKSSHCYIVPNQKLFVKFTTHNDTPPFIDSILPESVTQLRSKV